VSEPSSVHAAEPRSPERPTAEVVELPIRREAGALATDSDSGTPASLTGWGRHPVVQGRALEGEDLERISAPAILSRGLGRAYADAALPPEHAARPVAITPRADRILAWDPDTGVLRAEAGFSLGALREVFLPRGWFTPVSTGTRFVTLGGMVASDVHGKNHHVAGCIGRHVRAIRVRTGDGRLREASAEEHPDLFFATQGGMGLTGHVLEVELKLDRVPSPWILQESERFGSLAEVITALRDASAAWPMTMAWIDTSARGERAGRGIVIRGRWATPEEAPREAPRPKRSIAFPFDLPSGLMNPRTIGWANAVWYRLHGRKMKRRIVHPEPFFWPLDGIEHWNRAFGKRGFTQYQCVLPSAELYLPLLDIFQREGGCSFVTVFKDCGAEGQGHLSFPRPGTSLALDIPIAPDGRTERLCQALGEYVVGSGGRIYLAKDAFTSAEHFARMYPRLDEWREIRRRYDPERRLDSAQAQRLGL
jgi:decaprenylphospho-beta-D-ribofuranose 2-oxidase